VIKFDNFREEYYCMVGEIVLNDSMECCIYFGVYEDEDEEDQDVYYKCMDIHGKISYHTCVGGLMALNGKLDSDDYNNIKSSFESNLRFKLDFINGDDAYAKIATEIKEALDNYFTESTKAESEVCEVNNGGGEK
jgi:hypothetical protein